MFFNNWFRYVGDTPDARPREIVELVAQYLKDTCCGLINTREENGYADDDEDAPGMGLSIFVRARGFTKDVVDLLTSGSSIIDGEELAHLMIEHGVGVRSYRTVEFKRLDEDFFGEE